MYQFKKKTCLCRYRMSATCRGVAETVLRGTFMSMLQSQDVDAATLYAINSLTCMLPFPFPCMYFGVSASDAMNLADNALHMCIMPSVLERFIQRLIQFEPMLGMATLGILLKVPVVSMRSVLELMGGHPVSNSEDADAMLSYVTRCVEGRDGLCILPYVGMDEYSCMNPALAGKFPGYITCTALKEAYASTSSGTGGPSRPSGGMGQQQQQSSSLFGGFAPNGVPMEPVVSISKRLWMSNKKV